MINKVRMIGAVALLLSIVSIIMYWQYAGIDSIDEIRVGFGLFIGLLISAFVTFNVNGFIEKRVAKDKEMVTGFEGFTKTQMTLIRIGVALFLIGIGVWAYFVLR